MIQIQTSETDWDVLEEFVQAYFTELRFKNDVFFNERVFEGKPYQIILDGECAGFFSLAESKNKGKILRAFYLTHEKRRESMDIFAYIVKEYDVEAALVASNDEHLVSLAFETMNERGTSFDMQAFNLDYGKPTRPAEYGMECFVKVKPEEYEAVESVTERLWEGCFGDPAYEFYALKEGEEVLGYGAIESMKHNPKNADVGNFTMPEHRRKGVGRSIIINLSEMVIARGQVPTAGCWYGNKNSIMTLKSSGFIPENRLFHVRFQ